MTLMQMAGASSVSVNDELNEEDEELDTAEDRVTEWIFNYLLDDVVLGYAFDVHRAVSTGLWQAVEGVPEDEEPHKLVDDPKLDVFGQPRGQKKPLECACPQCNRTLAAYRFAPHLEKCMGMGRSSSRIASQRIAKTNRDNGADDDGGVPEDDDDDEWDFRSEAAKRAKPSKQKQEANNKAAQARATAALREEENEEDDVVDDDSNDEDFVLNGEHSSDAEFFDAGSNQSFVSNTSDSKKSKHKNKKTANHVNHALNAKRQKGVETPTESRSRSPSSPPRKFSPSPSPSSRTSFKDADKMSSSSGQASKPPSKIVLKTLSSSSSSSSATPSVFIVSKPFASPYEPYTAGPAEDITHYHGLKDKDKKALLKQICGALVEQGHKICTATKCNVHSEEDRRSARVRLTMMKSVAGLQVVDLPQEAQLLLKKKLKDKHRKRNSDILHRH
ncbi:unnamed protein product [Notodromas monacha]|uniref:SAGA-associated factor 11 homolog n=1 Tax=Notodromas monacha TaxID=399045 RepID=A0A7R9BIF2_9CRUS|nr:unnamed protein product [Notodromas monacha]CAG0915804.1 unnamed protein product [Notodromas monacha]